MLGNTILVAPVLEPTARSRYVKLPNGTWISSHGVKYNGGQTIEIEAPLDCLPYFKKEA